MAEGNGKEAGGKYAKLREGATRAERKEATLDDMRSAAAEVREAARELLAAAAAGRDQLSSISGDAARLSESARLIAGDGGDPAELYRRRMEEGARQAAEGVDFRGVLEAAAAELSRSSAEAAESIGSACREVGTAWGQGKAQARAAAMGRFFCLGCVVLAVSFVALTAACFAKMEPVFTGKAVVSYEPAYESELDRARLELELARNELEAYRRQYPYGIGETAQADLDAANRAAQEAYDAGHAG